MSILDMSVAGGVVILAVIVIRALGGRRLPKAVFAVLWTVALARLLVPVAVPSPVSVYKWLTPPGPETIVEKVPAAAPETSEPRQAAVSPAGRTAAARTAPAPSEGPGSAGRADRSRWTGIWAAGVLACGGVFAAAYIRGLVRFREAVPMEGRFVRRWQESHPLGRRVSVRLSGRVDTPMTYGSFRPVILLPAGTDWRDEEGLGFILAHEYGHIRRWDGAKKLVLTAAVCLHWFNPLVWAMLVLANRDMEIACDERVARGLEPGRRADYARTLIRTEEVRAGLTPLVSYFSANAMEERVRAIMKPKKWTAWIAIWSLILTLGVTAVFAASAPEDPAAPVPDPVPYDWGEAAVLFSLEEEQIGRHFVDVSIQWWKPDDFDRWVEEQKPLLEAAVGSTSDTGTVAGGVIWTKERSEEVLAAYEDVAGILRAGTGKLSKTVGGSGQMVIAVGMPWPLDRGGGKTVRGYDVEALMWGEPEDWPAGTSTQNCLVEREAGEKWVDLGPSQTRAGLFRTVRAYCQSMVQAGVMGEAEANGILEDWWSLYQDSEHAMPDRYRISAGPAVARIWPREK